MPALKIALTAKINVSESERGISNITLDINFGKGREFLKRIRVTFIEV